jgi:hypothetical protein
MSKTTASILLSALLTFPLAAIGQMNYKCKTPSGGTMFSDTPCPGGSRQEQAVYSAPPAQQYQAPQNNNARMLDAKVLEALGSGDIGRAKGLAVTPEHWQMISDAEQRGRQAPVTGRTDADLRASAGSSQECKAAQRSYDIEAGSLRHTKATVDAAKRGMYSACGMTEPTVIENKTVINDNRRSAPPPPLQQMRCRNIGNGNLDCW